MRRRGNPQRLERRRSIARRNPSVEARLPVVPALGIRGVSSRSRRASAPGSPGSRRASRNWPLFGTVRASVQYERTLALAITKRQALRTRAHLRPPPYFRGVAVDGFADREVLGRNIGTVSRSAPPSCSHGVYRLPRAALNARMSTRLPTPRACSTFIDRVSSIFSGGPSRTRTGTPLLGAEDFKSSAFACFAKGPRVCWAISG